MTFKLSSSKFNWLCSSQPQLLKTTYHLQTRPTNSCKKFPQRVHAQIPTVCAKQPVHSSAGRPFITLSHKTVWNSEGCRLPRKSNLHHGYGQRLLLGFIRISIMTAEMSFPADLWTFSLLTYRCNRYRSDFFMIVLKRRTQGLIAKGKEIYFEHIIFNF